MALMARNIIDIQYSPKFTKLALIASAQTPVPTYYFEGELRPKHDLLIYNRRNKKTQVVALNNFSVNAPIQWFNDERKNFLAYKPSLEYFDSWKASIGIFDTEKNQLLPIINNNKRNENIALSPNQKTLAYITNNIPATPNRPEVFQFSRIAVYDFEKHESLLLPETSDGSPRLAAFNLKGDALIFSEPQQGSEALNTINIHAPYEEHVISKQQGIIRKISVSHNNNWLGYTDEGPLRATRPCILSLTTMKETCFNKISEQQDLAFVNYQVIKYKSFDDKEIEALLAKPKKFPRAFSDYNYCSTVAQPIIAFSPIWLTLILWVRPFLWLQWSKKDLPF